MRTGRRRLWLVLVAALLALAGAAGWWLLRDLPSPENLQAYTSAPSSKIYDRYGRLLYEMPPPYTGSHTPVALDDIPLVLQQATIAVEDRNFYRNPGVDLVGILRAAWYNLWHDTYVMGGSTITQQLARNLMLAPDERYELTLRRKLREAVLAVRLTLRYPKEKILEFYLNESYYGNMAYGVEAAAQAYYGKHVRELDLAESAMLAVLPQAPAYWNPLENLEEAKKRQAIVLDRMAEDGYISAEQARLAKAENLSFAATRFPIRAPHFVMLVRAFLEQELGLERVQAGGLEVTTTLDVDLTEAARDIMRHRLELLAVCFYQTECPPGGHNVRNGAVVALDPATGEVLALVGSPDYFSAQIDGAVNGATALRQPGSSIKPITYAAAFESGTLTPATMMLDLETTFITREGTSYVPLNYDLVFRGPVRLREALGSSYNLIAVKVLDTIGIGTMVDLAQRMGIATFDDPRRLGLALTLGGGEVRLLELTAAYAVLANGGYRVAPGIVQSVAGADGQVLWSAPCGAGAPCPGDAVLDPRAAYLVTDILSDDLARIPTFGEGSVLNLTRPAAVKTGTTTDFRDNWTVGYTPELVVGVWVGNADNESMQDVSGVTGAAPIWHDVMETALKGDPAREFVRPEGLVEVEVCALSGELPNADCPHRVRELFIAGTQPQETCTMHQRIGGQVYTILPPEAQAWGREHGLEQPADAEPVGGAVLLVTGPKDGAVYRLDPAQPASSQRIYISAEAGSQMRSVALRVDGVVLAELSVPPYRTLWPLVLGRHTINAMGWLADGTQVTSEDVHIEVVD